MQQYLDLLDDILANGVERGDRTGTGTISVFGRQVRFDLEEGFPLVTTKKIHFKSCVHELLWFLSGDTNTKYLTDNGVRIWNEWADENGDLGPIYGAQWRNWGPCVDFVPSGDDKQIKANIFHFDQLGFIINQIKRDPFSRRHLVSAWNVMEIPKMNLPPCHYAYQFYVAEGKISCLCVMRSVDCFLGLPFDIADYALLLMMVGQITDLQPKDLVFQLGDTHIYSNHVDQVKLQLTREPLPLPTVTLNPEIKNIDDFGFDDIVLNNYKFHPHIKGDIAV